MPTMLVLAAIALLLASTDAPRAEAQKQAKSEEKARARKASERAAASKSERARLRAYFKLWKLGVRVELPRPPLDHSDSGEDSDSGDDCTAIPSGGSCGRTLQACPYSDRSLGGTGGYAFQSGVMLCPSKSDARRCAETPAALQAFGETAIGCPHCIVVPLFSRMESKCRPGDVGGAGCGACDCPEGEAGAECERLVARCAANAVQEERPNEDCQFVFVDACRGRLGAVCGGKAREFRKE